jgi:hypothetical protein
VAEHLSTEKPAARPFSGEADRDLVRVRVVGLVVEACGSDRKRL